MKTSLLYCNGMQAVVCCHYQMVLSKPHYYWNTSDFFHRFTNHRNNCGPTIVCCNKLYQHTYTHGECAEFRTVISAIINGGTHNGLNKLCFHTLLIRLNSFLVFSVVIWGHKCPLYSVTKQRTTKNY